MEVLLLYFVRYIHGYMKFFRAEYIATKNAFNLDDFKIESKLTMNQTTMKKPVLENFANL